MRKLFAIAVLCAACGSDVNDAPPMLIPGGGVGSGAINGKLNVYVIDARTDEAIDGAAVLVGTDTGTTDAAGLITFEGSLSGPQTITVTASGYAAATWIGANGANVTIPLSPNGAGAAPDSATVSGTIEGWDTLPAPAADHYYLALILYSWTDEIGAPENELPQGTTAGFPNNACISAPMFSQCDWTLITRTGPQLHYAIILDADSKGTITDFADDTFVVYGYAVKAGLDLTDGQTVSGEILEMVPDADLQAADVTFPQAPTGLDNVVGLPVIDLGEELVVLALPALTPTMTTVEIPRLTGAFAGGSYTLISRATPDEVMETPSTASLARDVDFSSVVAAPEWLTTPTNITAQGGSYTFTAAAGATVHAVDFLDVGGDVAWQVLLLDGSVAFTLPMLPTDALPAGMVTMSVSAFHLTGFDDQDFSLDDLSDQLQRFSQNQIEFTH